MDLALNNQYAIKPNQQTNQPTSLLNTQHYKAHTKGKLEQSREKSCVIPNILV